MATIVEQFDSAEKRNQRRNELLSQFRGHISRHTDQVQDPATGKWHMVWCVSYSINSPTVAQE